MLDKELELAIELSKQAGQKILYYYTQGVDAVEKRGADDHVEPVTIADIQANTLIVNGIHSRFPDDAVLSEEEPDDAERRLAADRLWIIDPLDGTAGFVKHDGDFAVQIGLAIDGKPSLGVVYLPFHQELYAAIAGRGAFVESGGSKSWLSSSNISDPEAMTAAVTRNHLTERILRTIDHFRFRSIVRRGSVGLKTGLIASGQCDVYIHPSPRTKIWDTCAPQVILEEAGGRITDLFGRGLNYRRRDLQNRDGLVASNGAAHDMIIERLQPLLREFDRKPFFSS